MKYAVIIASFLAGCAIAPIVSGAEFNNGVQIEWVIRNYKPVKQISYGAIKPDSKLGDTGILYPRVTILQVLSDTSALIHTPKFGKGFIMKVTGVDFSQSRNGEMFGRNNVFVKVSHVEEYETAGGSTNRVFVAVGQKPPKKIVDIPKPELPHTRVWKSKFGTEKKAAFYRYETKTRKVTIVDPEWKPTTLHIDQLSKSDQDYISRLIKERSLAWRQARKHGRKIEEIDHSFEQFIENKDKPPVRKRRGSSQSFNSLMSDLLDDEDSGQISGAGPATLLHR